MNRTGTRRKIAIGFTGGPYTVQQMTVAIQNAEKSGFDSAWLANDVGGRTPYVTLACSSMVTDTIRLGVAVSNPITRHPVELAQTAATLDEACNGRLVLGLGTGASWRSLISERWDKPIALMKESMQVIRELWSLPETTYRGVTVSIRDSDWIWPTGEPAKIRKDIPIVLGAGGPQMTRLAARYADGLTIALGKYVPDIRAQIGAFRITVEQAGRDPDTLDICPLIGIYVTESAEDFELMRRLTAFETHRLTEEEAHRRGFEPDAFRKIKEIYAREADEGGIVKYGLEPAAYEAAPHVTQTMLEAFFVLGTPDECVHQLQKYSSAGVNLPILVPHGCDLELTLEVGRRFLEAG